MANTKSLEIKIIPMYVIFCYKQTLREDAGLFFLWKQVNINIKTNEFLFWLLIFEQTLLVYGSGD